MLKNCLVSTTNCPGRYHTSCAMDSDDVIELYEMPEMKFYGLADGQTNKKFCREGGREVLKQIAEYFGRVGISRLCCFRFVDELQYEMIRIVRNTIARMAEKTGADRTEFASTLVIVAIDNRTGEFLTVHLGDGAIVGVTADSSVELISMPENGITSQYTWLTTSHDAMLHVRIGRGKIDRYSRVMVVSDGADCVCRGKTLGQRAKIMLQQHCAAEKMICFVENSRSEDDASCIILDLEHTGQNEHITP